MIPQAPTQAITRALSSRSVGTSCPPTPDLVYSQCTTVSEGSCQRLRSPQPTILLYAPSLLPQDLHLEVSLSGNLSQIPLLRPPYGGGGGSLKTLFYNDSVLSEYSFSLSLSPPPPPSPWVHKIAGASGISWQWEDPHICTDPPDPHWVPFHGEDWNTGETTFSLG